MEQFRSYLLDIWRDSGRRLPAAITLVALGAVLEGIGIIAILPFAALITGNADTQIAQSILAAMDSVGLTTEWLRALALSIGFLLLLASRNVVVWLRDYRLQELGMHYVDNWRARLFDAVGKADWLVVGSVRRSEIEHAIANDISRLSAGTAQMLRTGAAAAISLVQLLIVALLSPMLLVLIFGLLVVALLFTIPLMRKANLLGGRLTHSGRSLFAVIGDFMSSQKLARLNNAESEFAIRFKETIGEIRRNQLVFTSSQLAAKGWFQFAAGGVVIAALLIGFFVLQTPLSVLAVTLLVLARLASPVQMIANTGQSLANTLPAFAALMQLHATLRDAQVPRPETSVAPYPQTPARLELRGITFTYPASQKPVLDEADFAIAAGEIVALTGASGNGKTTLLDLISGLLIPRTGQLIIDGKPTNEQPSMRAWRDQIAYLPQDPFLFDASLRENLLWSAKKGSEAAIRDALEAASAESFLDRDNGRMGLDMRAGERGQALSGGERQRLCLARALLRQPRLLILDEATNALDPELEDRILARLSGLTDRFSILLVTHRKETLRHADRVAELAKGKIVSR